MSFDYDQNRKSHSGDSFWTSYSDLFLGLSTIFLLLYVTASLRTGTDAIKSQVENQKLTMEVEELKSQLKMYEQVKTDYMQNNASESEQKEYQELMDKLTLLKEDAKNDQERLAEQSLENERKAQALNKYQQMIRNIINANKLAKTKINTRNTEIAEQDTTIDTQKQDISKLEVDISQKQKLIKQGEAEIAETKDEMTRTKKQLLLAYKHNKLTKKQFEKKTAALQAENNKKISELLATNQTYNNQLLSLKAESERKERELQATQSNLVQTKGALAQTQGALAETKGALDQTKGALAETQGALAQTKGALDQTKGQLNQTKGALDQTKGALAQTQGALKQTEAQLAKAKEERDTRRAVAEEIKKGFQAAGIKADVDMQTGEVVLDFGDAYFESNSSNLNLKMKEIIEKAMPVYSKSLLGNKKVADKVSAVEIIGFASPTYQGRYVDPMSEKPEDKKALKYNMDLSYRRANSIFSYLVEEKSGTFAHKQELLSRMKVSGRSFLDIMQVKNRGPASAAEFCKQNDCKKAQKVIVRFSMDGKK